MGSNDRRTNYESDIVMGDVYVDEQTGIEGVAVGVFFFQYGCERVTIERFNKKSQEVSEFTVDAPRLTHKESGKRAETTRTGGPDKHGSGSRAAGVYRNSPLR